MFESFSFIVSVHELTTNFLCIKQLQSNSAMYELVLLCAQTSLRKFMTFKWHKGMQCSLQHCILMSQIGQGARTVGDGFVLLVCIYSAGLRHAYRHYFLKIGTGEPGQLTCYGSYATEWMTEKLWFNSNQGKKCFYSQQHSDWFWNPSTALYSGQWRLFPWE